MKWLASLTFSIMIISLSCSKSDELAITFGGDVLLDRGVARQIKLKGADALFANISSIFKKSDATVINLECVLSDTSDPIEKQFNFRASCSLATYLNGAGITHASIANNHSFDHGVLGFNNTMNALSNNGVSPIGESQTPVLIKKGNQTVALFGVNMVTNELPSESYDYIYSPTQTELVNVINSYNKEYPDHLIAVNIHWGYEYREFPSSVQQELGKKLIDSGAKIIVGHHPHVLQPIEYYKDGVIVYSLGNLVFDQEMLNTKHSILLTLNIKNHKIRELAIKKILIKNSLPAIELDGDSIKIIGESNNIKLSYK